MPLRASASLAPSNANATAAATVIGRGCKTNPRRMCCCRPEHFAFTVPAGKAGEGEICSIRRTEMLRPEISHHFTSCPFPSRKWIVTVTVPVVFCACQDIQGYLALYRRTPLMRLIVSAESTQNKVPGSPY
ncbi:Uncharacterized protein LW94_3452 [Fusarium fujikuroi]|nr:Uncharacterized protein LW94_3452 [Fusarium fujikuroi]